MTASKSYTKLGACTPTMGVFQALADMPDCPPGEEASRLVMTPDGEMVVLRNGRLEETVATFTPAPALENR